MKKSLIVLLISFFYSGSLVAQNSIDYSKLVRRQGVFYQINSENPYSGKTTQTHPNGQKALEGSFLKGKRNGKWVEWYSNGQKLFEGSYKNGNYDGKISKWEITGMESEEVFYFNGILNGTCKLFHNNGNPKFEGNYSMGQYDGLISEYSYDGELTKSANYINGVLNGEYYEDPKNGNRIKCVYKDGKLNGRYTEYHYTGKPAFYGNFENDLREGEFIYQYPDGSLKKKINYLHNSKEGDVLYYSDKETAAPDGKLRAKMHYDNDKLNGKYISWKTIGVGQQIFTAEEFGGIIEQSDIHNCYKLEGCFINGNPDGIFKFWGANNCPDSKSSVYSRIIFENGVLIDDGWNKYGGLTQYKPNGELTECGKLLSKEERWTKKYIFACEDEKNQNEIVQANKDNNSPPSKYKLTKNDFSKYIGDTLNGMRYGKGKQIYENGSAYDGLWKDNKREGEGVFTFSNGTKVVGIWKDDDTYGNIKCTYPSGATYDGEMKNDKRNGTGKITAYDEVTKTSIEMEGTWVDDKLNGSGSGFELQKDGRKNILRGEFKDNKLFNGTIEYNYKNGKKTIQDVINGVRGEEKRVN